MIQGAVCAPTHREVEGTWDTPITSHRFWFIKGNIYCNSPALLTSPLKSFTQKRLLEKSLRVNPFRWNALGGGPKSGLLQCLLPSINQNLCDVIGVRRVLSSILFRKWLAFNDWLQYLFGISYPSFSKRFCFFFLIYRALRYCQFIKIMKIQSVTKKK